MLELEIFFVLRARKRGGDVRRTRREEALLLLQLHGVADV